jgi:hypothetical protein
MMSGASKTTLKSVAKNLGKGLVKLASVLDHELGVNLEQNTVARDSK